MNNTLQENVGIWINHETAYIVTLKNTENTIRKIEYIDEGNSRLSGDSLYKNNNDRTENLLNIYYEKIIKLLNMPDSIVICGPDEAKEELLKRLENSQIGILKNKDTRYSKKMSENQIIAYIKDFFPMP